MRSLLDADYPTLEVIVVDDGSRDGTVEALRAAFSLVQVERVPRSRLRTRRVSRAYASPLDARLLVLDKEPGGRADALNTGLRFARYPLVCPVDPHVALDRDALARMAREFQTIPGTIACGAGTRIAPGERLAARAPAVARTPAHVAALAHDGGIGSAARCSRAEPVAVFSREAVVAAGGYADVGRRRGSRAGAAPAPPLLDAGRTYRIAALPRPAASIAPGRGVREPARRARRGALGAPRHAAAASLRVARLRRAAGADALVARAPAARARRGRLRGRRRRARCRDPALELVELVLLASAPLGLSLAAALLEQPPGSVLAGPLPTLAQPAR